MSCIKHIQEFYFALKGETKKYFKQTPPVGSNEHKRRHIKQVLFHQNKVLTLLAFINSLIRNKAF